MRKIPFSLSLIQFVMLILIAQSAWSNELGPKGVIGRDDRIQITEKNQRIIHHSMGALSVRYNTNRFRCSGTVIGPRHVITAAHCLYQGNKFPDKVIFYPGLLMDPNSSDLPFGKFVSTNVKVFPSFKTSRIENNDVGMVIFDEDLPVRPLKIGAANRLFNLKFSQLIVTGYPGDKPNGTLWESRGRSNIKFDQNVGTHFLDTMPGMSGASIRIHHKIVAIHSSGQKDENGKFIYNKAHFFNRKSLATIQDWLKE